MDTTKTPNRTNPSHLPGFLLGDVEPIGFAESTRVSVGGNMTTSPKDVEMTMAGSISPQPLTPCGVNYGRVSKPLVSGPPTISLYDEVNSIPETKENQPLEKSEILNQSLHESNEGHWVVVWPSTSPHVLSLFSQIGTVVDSSFPASGNWLFIKYATRSDARKALSYDARVINGNIMIGVREGKQFNQMRTAYPSTPTLQNSSMLNRTAGSPSLVVSPKIRSLGTPKRSLPVQQSLDSSTTTATGSPSVVSKAFDILFGGW